MTKLILASEFDVLFPKIKNSGIFKSYKKAVFIPTACMYKEKDYVVYFENQVQKQFSSLSITSEILEISAHPAQEVERILQACDIVYVGGGNTFFLLEKMKNCNFKNALNKFFKKGGLYIGSSAGAIVTCPDIGFIQFMDEPEKANLKNYTGLGYIDFPLIPHLDHEKYSKDAITIRNELKTENKPVIGLKDNQGLFVQGNYIELL